MAGVTSEKNAAASKLEVDLNLVPFIDLLSTLVLFLLLTVVWIQIGVIPASNDGKGKSTLSEVDQSKLIVTLGKGHFDLSWPTAINSKGLAKKASDLGQLIQIVQSVLKSGAQFPATVRADDQTEYSAVIETLDSLKETGLSEISLGVD